MRQEKQLLLDEIKDGIEQSPAFVVARYEKVDANQANDFRKQVAEAGGLFKVVAKRVLVKAMEAAGIEDFDESAIQGSVGVVFATEDPVSATKAVFDWSKSNEKAVAVLTGRFDGKMYSADQVEQLSKLPSKDEMRAQLLATFEAPLSQTLAVVEALLTAVPHCLENKAKKESGES